MRHLRLDIGLFVKPRRPKKFRSAEGASAPSFVSASPDPPDWLLQRILYRDDQILVLDKPAGLAVHPGPATPESLERYLPSLRFGKRLPPQPVHRLDRDTSGCLVLARNRVVLKELAALFAAGRVEKTYWALVTGVPRPAEGRIEANLSRRNDRSGWRMIVDPAGMSAVTEYRVLASREGTSLLELHPRTGRTHQIRVHCAHLGIPILGDPIYGTGNVEPPHRLHARRIILPLGRSAAPLDIEAPPPIEMMAYTRFG